MLISSWFRVYSTHMGKRKRKRPVAFPAQKTKEKLSIQRERRTRRSEGLTEDPEQELQCVNDVHLVSIEVWSER